MRIRMQAPGQLGVGFWQAEVFEEQRGDQNLRAEPRQLSCLAGFFPHLSCSLSTTA